MNSYHDVRSIRSWLTQLYPDVDILVQRNQQAKSKKSYFFLQDVREKHEDTGSAFFNTVRSINIHLITEGKTPSNPNSTDAYWKTNQVLSFLRDKLLRERVVPQFIFNEPWYPPVGWTKPGGAHTAGTYELACTSVDRYNKESLLSNPATFELQDGDRLFLQLTNWPLGHPLNIKHVLYTRATPTDPWKAIAEVPASWNDRGSQQIELLSFDTIVPDQNPPQTSKQWMGHLKVDTATMTMMESVQVDDSFHGFVALSFRSRAPQRFRTVAPVNSVGTTIVVS